MKLFRREFLHRIRGAAVVAASRLAWAQETLQHVRIARAARDMAKHRMAGAEAGLFRKRGIAYFAGHCRRRSAGCRRAIRGDWEFAHTGTLPVAEEVLKGNDIVILATPTLEFSNSFIMTRKEITQLAQSAGKKVGVLTETGQTARRPESRSRRQEPPRATCP